MLVVSGCNMSRRCHGYACNVCFHISSVPTAWLPYAISMFLHVVYIQSNLEKFGGMLLLRRGCSRVVEWALQARSLHIANAAACAWWMLVV